MTLMAFGAFLATVGACDLLRADRDDVSVLRQLLMVAVGAAGITAFLAWAGDGVGGSVLLGLGLLSGLAMWVVGSAGALRRGPRGGALRSVAFGGLGVGAVVSLLGVGALEEWLEWPTRLEETFLARWPAYDVVVAAGALLLQLATANIVVRLLLDAVGVPATTNEKKLKGGRLLGPMERIFIVGLGAIGETTAAAIVVAAKGLLRFPELQTSTREGPSDVTEYFLIGSFASWLLGLAGVAMIYLA
ncbi:hypothetical protein HNR19_003517 [Nocardioides thalensis]|uniref:Uncharacterized protein n=1 Tax=Nocardioides thalensis TaxID=1914755 RepID=A0A853C6E5_9ACTN|nr:hypothetical protein [Nocardioides thalensis]NYJ02819.1 hypothetical protein [Nocardioides thalensis]